MRHSSFSLFNLEFLLRLVLYGKIYRIFTVVFTVDKYKLEMRG